MEQEMTPEQKRPRIDHFIDTEMAESSDMDPEKCPINPRESEVMISSPNDSQRISLISDLWIVVSVITFIADVGSDLLVSIQYYNQNRLWYFGITVGFVVIASLVLQIFSAKWFIDDGKKSCKLFVLHLVQMGPLTRYWSAIRLCWMSRSTDVTRPYELLIPKWRDLCMLRLLQAFIQAAPQSVFQLYVLCRKGSFSLGDDLVILLAAITSLITVVWALVCYSKALRDLRDNAQDLPWLGFTCQVLWRGCMLTSRVVALVLFASYFRQWMILAVIGHWMLMAMWLACQRTQFCLDENGREHPWKERLFNSLIAFIYVFSFFNTKEGMTRKRVVLFYSVMLVENSLLISMWYPNRNLSPTMTYSALGVVWGGFVLGLVFMIIYYKCYHHSRPFKGLFIRTKTFKLHGRKMYGLYFCCCCRVKMWDVAIYDCRESRTQSPDVNLDVPAIVPVERNAEAFPRDNPNDGNLHWDNDDIQLRPVNGSCIRSDDPDHAVLIQHPIAVDDDDPVPDIVVTAASPLLSPQESLGKLSTDETPNPEAEPEEDMPPLSPGQSSLDKAREILATKLNKDDDTPTKEDPEDIDDDIPQINYGTVSFGNRYSLVSSDCISISSESSLSSFTSSLNDLLDRMGVAPKNGTDKHGDLKVSTADEGIFSDERESPAKSCDTETEPSPLHGNMVNGHENGDSDTSKDESTTLEKMMDAPSSPYVNKKKLDKDEGSESESTDASSDDRERRYSCEDLEFSFIHSTPNEEKTKRHSFDISDLSSKYKRVKKKGKNKRRFNKIVIFDNFVSSALKPGKFGSLRKSFERLSQIQEDTEESGLLSNDSLREKRDTLCDDLPSPGNGIAKNIEPSLQDDTSNTEPVNPVTNHVTDNKEDNTSDSSDDIILQPIEETSDSSSPLMDLEIEEMPNFEHINNLMESEDRTTPEQNYTNWNGQLDHTAEPNRERSDDKLSDQDIIIQDLIPSRFSTVRRSRDNVPLACFEDDDLGSSTDDGMNDVIHNNVIDDVIDDVKPPELVSPTDKNVSFQRNWSLDSIADSDSSREAPNSKPSRSLASSGSSVFENFLYLENDQHASGAHTNKRHTFDFGAHRTNKAARQVKRLSTSSSQYTLPRAPGSPVWVHKAVNSHRRRKPKPVTQANNDAIRIIQEIRV